MIANARMYSVCAHSSTAWNTLLSAVARSAHQDMAIIEHSAPKPIAELWQRTDMAAVFMCGLPISRAAPRPLLIAAPIPSLPEFGGQPQYWSEWVVHTDSAFSSVEATFGGRLALTEPNSQSGFAAALEYLMPHGGSAALYQEVIAPTVNPQGAINAVITGAAEVAPVDAYAFALLQKHRHDLTSKLRVVGRTVSTPIPALVASSRGLDALIQAFSRAHHDPALRNVMSDLLLERFVRPDPAQYDALRVNFETALEFWRAHPLARIVHPAFVL
jgi:ABC-type phosphate/phosphonate transport system substrate-binding protein